MKVLIAEDNDDTRELLRLTLSHWDYEVEAVADGLDASRVLCCEDHPPIALLDRMMPGLSGIEVCQAMRAFQAGLTNPTYVILLTALGTVEDIVEGFHAGADDYLAKPYHPDELRVRLAAGVRFVTLQDNLNQKVGELEHALSQVKQLQEILPLCSYCKSVRDDHDYWQKIENYISTHTDTRISHSVCPDCYAKIVEPQLREFERKLKSPG